MERLPPNDIDGIINRINNGCANIYDILNAIDLRIFDFPELHRPKNAKIFSPFISPILNTGNEQSIQEIIRSTTSNIFETLVNKFEQGELQKLDGQQQFIDIGDRYMTNQEFLRYYYLALKFIEDNFKLKQHSTPFDIVNTPLKEEREIINGTIILNMILDSFCEIIDKLKFSNSINNIDTGELNYLFNKYIEIKENSKNMSKIKILKMIRNCIRHNDYKVRINATINIKTQFLEIDIKNPFFDDFNHRFIKYDENDTIPIQRHQLHKMDQEESFEKNKNTIINRINQFYQTNFSEIDWEKGFESNKNTIINLINQFYQININQEQITIMEDCFKKFKFTETTLDFCLHQIHLDSVKKKFLFRRIMIDLIGYIFDIENYDTNYIKHTIIHNNKISNNIVNDLIHYIKLQCIKYYYINNSSLNPNNEDEIHLRNCFVHGWYTDSFFCDKIAICDKNIHRIDTTTGAPLITYQNIYTIDELYNKIEIEGGFSNPGDIEGNDTLKGFIVGNITEENKTGKLKIQYRYLLYDKEKGKYKVLYNFGSEITKDE